jgi:glycosyltransferase involved in cell wall biosynthesis
LRIAVNTRLLLKDKLEGIGWFTFENLQRITKAHPEHQFYFLFDRPYNHEFIFSNNITPVVLYPQARHPFLYYIWFQFSVKRALKKIKPDLFISTDGYLPLNLKCKSLIVFHDLNFEHYPQDVPFFERWYYKTFFPKFSNEANRIATVSEYSKQDIIQLYNVPADKIDVVYNGANEAYTPLSTEEKQIVRQRLTGGTPYFYFIGSLHPRKNLANLFRAYDIFRKSSHVEVNLVITGVKKWWTKDIEAVFAEMAYKKDVIFTGRLDVAEARETMAAAMALTYVSYFEGFGIPIIEAFRCGTPVITSNVTSMPEISGDAAMTADPFDTGSISRAMLSIVNNDALREELITRGFDRSKEFTWDKSAANLWNSILKTVN